MGDFEMIGFNAAFNENFPIGFAPLIGLLGNHHIVNRQRVQLCAQPSKVIGNIGFAVGRGNHPDKAEFLQHRQTRQPQFRLVAVGKAGFKMRRGQQSAIAAISPSMIGARKPLGTTRLSINKPRAAMAANIQKA